MKKKIIIIFCVTLLINIIIATFLIIFSHRTAFLETLMILGISILLYIIWNLFFYLNVKFHNSLGIRKGIFFIGLTFFSFILTISFFFVLIVHEYLFVIIILPILTTSGNWLISIYNEKNTEENSDTK